ncbi:MAG: hypothetical protein BM556_00065 [Bacteriovorax sp. MedPE-SWde]|nr:MAG: hypothetical protein BM556_00065 [Bacteriovorax sp. MedPE-SWde]
MVRKLKVERFMILFTLGLLALVSSCVESPGNVRKGGEGVENSKASVDAGNGRYLADNPIILSGNANLSETTNLATLLSPEQSFITNNTQLKEPCFLITDCIQVTEDFSIEPFTNSDTKWAFAVNTTEFLQVNTFAHINIIADQFHSNLLTHYNTVATPNVDPSLPTSNYPTSLPSTLFTSLGHWSPLRPLTAYADCNFENNASFSPSTFELCMGFDQIFKDDVKFAQDNTVIYHEVGHGLVDIMMNMRNTAEYARTIANPMLTDFVIRSDLGYGAYDEAGSINEGIADYFSYYVNQRPHMGEWALGRFNNLSRAMKEDDSIHAAGIAVDENSRLSYPTYLTYNPNNTKLPTEDIHYAGQIFSHYLTALSEDIESKCSVSKTDAIRSVSHVLTEALAELGDLTAQGNDFHTGKTSVNLNSTMSQDWLRANNPITYRKLSQYMGKYLLNVVVNSETSLCSANNVTPTPSPLPYSKEDVEILLDQYGLLLFRTYNDNGNGKTGDEYAFAPAVTAVTALNRKRSELLAKSHLQVEVRNEYNSFDVLDSQATIKAIIDNFLLQGRITGLSELSDPDFGYNNGNGKVSPGEIVGIFVNTFNDSNSVIAGARVLATDWAHMENDLPCANLTDGFPSIPQGGTTCTAVTDANYSNVDRFQPVCMLEYNDGTSTKMLSQKEFFNKLKVDAGLLGKDCLDPDAANGYKDCMIRAIPGADFQNLSVINPKSNWLETIKKEDGSPDFNDGSFMYFEVNKNIPIGTNVTCRLRSTFTNCDDCYHDAANANDDYKDWEYATEKPFNIINIKFQVLD